LDVSGWEIDVESATVLVVTIAEFKVVTSTFADEYGRGGFAQANVVTRVGTKEFHGSFARVPAE